MSTNPENVDQYRRKSSRTISKAVAAVLFLVTSCSSHDSGKDLPRVSITGDSTTRLSQEEIKKQLGSIYTVDSQGKDGQRIDQMLDELEDQVSQKPEASIVYLGTNDVMQENLNWKPGFKKMLKVLKDVPCVQLVTVNTDTDEFNGSTNVTATGINSAIDEAVVLNPNMHKIQWDVDWKAEMQAQDSGAKHLYSRWKINEKIAPEGAWLGDGVHQSPEGSRELVGLYEKALVDDCFVS